MTYCEGSAVAEVLFSLTGGREGRITSYNPPVEIFQGKAYRYALISYSASVIQTSEGLMNTLRTFISGFVYLKKAIGKWMYVNQREVHYFDANDNLLYVAKSIWSAGVLGKGVIELNVGFTNIYWIPEAQTKTYQNVFIISDTEGTLYAHEMPDQVSYSVKCIGCEKGECAGSDGKGGVICMDCRQMKTDIKYMQYKLK